MWNTTMYQYVKLKRKQNTNKVIANFYCNLTGSEQHAKCWELCKATQRHSTKKQQSEFEFSQFESWTRIIILYAMLSPLNISCRTKSVHISNCRPQVNGKLVTRKLKILLTNNIFTIGAKRVPFQFLLKTYVKNIEY